jgi:hypothetical protein
MASAAYRRTSIPAALVNPVVTIHMSDGVIASSTGRPSVVALSGEPCTPDPIIPEPGCEGGGSGGGGTPAYCDLTQIILEPGCIVEGETFSPVPPVAGPLPELTTGSIPEPLTQCMARLDAPHYSNHAPGWINVVAQSTCPINQSLSIEVFLDREYCVWIFCQWYGVSWGAYANPSARLVKANAAYNSCNNPRSWFTASSFHQRFALSSSTFKRLTLKPYAWRFDCWSGILPQPPNI